MGKKMSEYMAGRDDGLLLALKIVKEDGVEALEKEIHFRNLTGIHTALAKKELDQASVKIKEMTIDTITILSAATLRDEFEFGKKRISRFINRLNLKAECLMDDYVTWQEIIDDRGIGADQEIFIRAAAGQMGIALDREMIYSEQEQTRLEVEREHLKSSMLRSISHDFRTPLTGIIGDCDLILKNREGDSAQNEALVKDIREQSLWLTRTMENILSMTKIENGTDFIEKKQEVIEDLVYEAEGHITGLREHRRFSDSMPEELLTADVDGRLIIQVLVNLLDNAVKNTEEGGHIGLSVSFQEGKAYFVVEDDGRGIEPGKEQQIFGEFISLGGKGPDQKHGIGLGLAICREVVEAHGGRIWAENRLEGGARFTFWVNAEVAG